MLVIRIFILHLLIAAAYLGYTNYRFIISNPPNPIGIGFSQWILLIMHFIVTLVTIGILKNSGKVKNFKKNWMTHAAAIGLIIAVYAIVSKPLWAWMWTLRNQ